MAALEDHVKALQERKQQLIEALVYRNILGKDDFDEQYAQLKEEMTLTEMHRDELKREELDVEGALAFSQYVMLNAARLWAEASLDQKQRLQQALFNEGVTFSAATFGTASTFLLFNLLNWLAGVNLLKNTLPIRGLERPNPAFQANSHIAN